MIAVTRFTVSGNSTLYYQPSNTDATCTIKIFEDHGQSWTLSRTVQVSLEEHSYTISELLGQLNEKTTGSRVKFSVTSSGKFKAEVVESGTREVECELEISEPLAKILGFKEAAQSLKYRPSYYDLYVQALEWLRITTQNLLDVKLALNPVTPQPVAELTRLHKWVCPTFGLAPNGEMTFYAEGQNDIFYFDFNVGDTIICDSPRSAVGQRTRSYLVVNRLNAGVTPLVMSFLPAAAPRAPLEHSVCFLAQDCFGFTYSAEVADVQEINRCSS